MTSERCPELMGAAEIGRHLGVSRQRVQQLVRTDGFPVPAAHLDMGKVWLADEVRDWASRRSGPQSRPVS